MPDLATLLLFAGSAATLVLIPGPYLAPAAMAAATGGRRT